MGRGWLEGWRIYDIFHLLWHHVTMQHVPAAAIRQLHLCLCPVPHGNASGQEGMPNTRCGYLTRTPLLTKASFHTDSLCLMQVQQGAGMHRLWLQTVETLNNLSSEFCVSYQRHSLYKPAVPIHVQETTCPACVPKASAC